MMSMTCPCDIFFFHIVEQHYYKQTFLLITYNCPYNFYNKYLLIQISFVILCQIKHFTYASTKNISSNYF